MKIKKLLLTFSAALLLLTGCGENSIHKADFIIDPNSPTLIEDTKAAYDKLVNTCKVETATWRTVNNDFFVDYQPLEIRMAEYRHFTLLYNEYYTYLPSSTTNLLNDYRNKNTRNTWDMYSRADYFNSRILIDRGRFPSHLEDDLKFQANMLTIIDEATYDEQRGFVVYYDIFYEASEFLRGFYFQKTKEEYQFQIAVGAFVVRMSDDLYYDLNDNDKRCVQLFYNRYKEEILDFTDFFLAAVSAYNGIPYHSPLK